MVPTPSQSWNPRVSHVEKGRMERRGGGKHFREHFRSVCFSFWHGAFFEGRGWGVTCMSPGTRAEAAQGCPSINICRVQEQTRPVMARQDATDTQSENRRAPPLQLHPCPASSLTTLLPGTSGPQESSGVSLVRRWCGLPALSLSLCLSTWCH